MVNLGYVHRYDPGHAGPLVGLEHGHAAELGTTLPFSLASVPPDSVFNANIMSCVRFLISDLREFSEFLPDATDPDMMLEQDMGGLSYYVNLAMIIGRRS